MSEMIERVSNAILAKLEERNGLLAEEIARVVIKAMREPTKAMVHAGDEAVPPFGDHNPEAAWKAMIDEILSDGRRRRKERQP